MKKFIEYINEASNHGFVEREYHEFKSTFYRPPNSIEMEKINESGMRGEEILKGLIYTMVGRGMFTENTKVKIKNILESFVKKFPKNREKYQEAIRKLEEKESRF